MKKLIWKIIYKIIERWRRVAKKNRLDEQELNCIRILVGNIAVARKADD